MGTVTVKREGGDGNTLFFHLAEDGRLTGASGMGPSVGKDIRLAELLIERGASPDPVDLADPAVKLKSLLQANAG
jgi:3-phenylpropionate/trans-cinnamate dioxygenase ferredoxin reductase subunit